MFISMTVDTTHNRGSIRRRGSTGRGGRAEGRGRLSQDEVSRVRGTRRIHAGMFIVQRKAFSLTTHIYSTNNVRTDYNNSTLRI